MSVPRQVHSIAGPVRVRRVRNLVDPDDGLRCNGLYDPDTRRISIDADLADEVACRIAFHEQFHAWLDDLGIRLPLKTEEQLCDAYASGRMGERRRAA